MDTAEVFNEVKKTQFQYLETAIFGHVREHIHAIETVQRVTSRRRGHRHDAATHPFAVAIPLVSYAGSERVVFTYDHTTHKKPLNVSNKLTHKARLSAPV